LATVLNQIGQTQWQGERPLGPLGQFVDLKDGQWMTLMQLTLGQ